MQGEEVITEECLGCGQSAAAAAGGGGLLPCGGPPPAFVKERERNTEVRINWAPSRPTHGSYVCFPLRALAAAVHSLATRARIEFSQYKRHAAQFKLWSFWG